MKETLTVQPSNLAAHMSRSIREIIHSAWKTSLTNPREMLFLASFAVSQQRAVRKRLKAEKAGRHIPPFLIASITTRCNLFCKGCYARANQSCGEIEKTDLMPSDRWGAIFTEASQIGIAFILLAGGEPMLNRAVLDQAARIKKIIFPVFTNGTLFDTNAFRLFDRNRNLVPIISLEGERSETDDRRGEGTFAKVLETMKRLHDARMLYGVSVTVTTENIHDIASDDFIEKLSRQGCQVIIYVEYVPVTHGSRNLAPGEAEREYLAIRILEHRQEQHGIIFLSFPGDEKKSGGCLAAGRGFFHINASGGAEPCPFSPFSDTSLMNDSLNAALDSPLFRRLNEEDFLLGEHTGGCLLFEKEEEVKAMIRK